MRGSTLKTNQQRKKNICGEVLDSLHFWRTAPWPLQAFNGDFHRAVAVKLAGQAFPAKLHDVPQHTFLRSVQITETKETVIYPTCETNIRRCAEAASNNINISYIGRQMNMRQFHACPMLAAPRGSRSIWSKTYSKSSSPFHHHFAHSLTWNHTATSVGSSHVFSCVSAPNPGYLQHMHFLLLRRCIPSNSIFV